MYRDYPESSTIFHWESQSGITVHSPTGQRYIHHDAVGSQIFLLVRRKKTRDGFTEPYMFAGPVHYVSHQGERPMAIRWRLDHDLPAEFVQAARAAG